MTDNLSKLLKGVVFGNWTTASHHFLGNWQLVVPPNEGSFVLVSGHPCVLNIGIAYSRQLQPGDVVLIPPGVKHSIESSGSMPGEAEQPTFLVRSSFTTTSHTHSLLTRLWSPPLHDNLSNRGMEALSRLVSGLGNDFSEITDGNEFINTQFAKLICLEFLRCRFLMQDRQELNDGGWMATKSDPKISVVLAELHDEPGKDWTIHQMARVAKMSKSGFCERFRQIVGAPPLQYLTSFRMQCACNYLKSTDIGIKEIASRVGYETASSFTNAFKKRIGISPGLYRATNEPIDGPAVDDKPGTQTTAEVF